MSAEPGRLAMPRRRGTASGLLILLLGVWGALIPFVGPYFDWTVGPDSAWDFSGARLVLQALPGVVAIVGGLLLMGAANRGSGALGAQLAIAAGAWFAVGPTVSALGGVPDVGQPLSTGVQGVLQQLTAFEALGALLCVLGGMALARVSARLEGDRERLAAATSSSSAAAAAGSGAREPQRDRAIVPPRREQPAGDDAARTRVAHDDTSATRVNEPRHDDTSATRVNEPRHDDTSATRVDEPARDDAGDTRVLGDRDRGTGSPPPPDPGTRAG